MKRISATFAALLAALAAAAGPVALEWAAFLEDARPARFTVVRGDTVELAARLFADGRPYLPDAADASLLWQTNGMGALWWEAPASVSSNRVSAAWTPAMDSGAPSYLAHFRVGSGTGSVFRAYARLSMQHGPGDPPNALPLPVPVIDFAKVVVTNAPWGEGGGTDGRAVTNIVEGIVASATNGVVKAEENGDVNISGSVYANGGIYLSGGINSPGELNIGSVAAAGNADISGILSVGGLPLGTAAYRDASSFAAADTGRASTNYTDAAIAALDIRTNLPPVSASATVGELADSVNAVIRAMRKEDE